MTSLPEMKKAIQDAEHELRKADMCVETMVGIIAGRLKNVKYPDYPYSYCKNLAKLKRELRGFNIKTGTWRETKK